jgi:hypothetical protein
MPTTKKTPKPATGKSIAQNLKLTLARVKNVPKTVGTGIIQS